MTQPVVGIAWYSRATWTALRAVAPDAADLEATYEEWLAVVASAGVAELTARAAANRLVVELEDDGGAAAVASALAGRAWLKSLDITEGALRMSVADLPAAQREIPAAIAAAGVALRRFEIEEASLEDVFVQLVGGPPR